MSTEFSNYADCAYIVMRVLLWIAMVLAVIFPFAYNYTSRGAWRLTPIGRHIMAFRATVAALLVGTALSVFLPVEVTLTIAIALYAIVILILSNQLRFIIDPEAMDPENLLDQPAPDASPLSLLIQEKEPHMKSRPVVITMSVLAALQFLFGGLVTLNLPDGSFNETVLTVGAIGTLAVAAAQFGIQFYVQNLVTPHVDVAAFRNSEGSIVAGPAAPPEGAPVDVVDDLSGLHHEA